MSGEGTMEEMEEDARVAAKAYGHQVIRGKDRHLQLDLDDLKALCTYDDRKAWFFQRFNAEEIARWKSKSGGTHIIILLAEPLPAAERCILQACLGSDWKREALAVCRLQAGVEEPSMLFRPRASCIT